MPWLPKQGWVVCCPRREFRHQHKTPERCKDTENYSNTKMITKNFVRPTLRPYFEFSYGFVQTLEKGHVREDLGNV